MAGSLTAQRRALIKRSGLTGTWFNPDRFFFELTIDKHDLEDQILFQDPVHPAMLLKDKLLPF